MQSSGHWTLLCVEECLWRESPGPEKPCPRRCLPYSIVLELVLSEVLDHAVCLLTRRLMGCQAAMPCRFESTRLTFAFLRSHLSCYQLGSSLVDQWKSWRCTDLFFSGIDKPMLQDPQLRLGLANWWLRNFQRRQGEGGGKAKKSKKTHSPCVATVSAISCKQYFFHWLLGFVLVGFMESNFSIFSLMCLTWGLNQRNLLAGKLWMQNSGVAAQVLPSANTVCLKVVTALGNWTGEGNICKLKTKQWESPGMEVLD